jgi:hypothetical protein
MRSRVEATMRGFLVRLWNNDRPADDGDRLGDFDPYLVELVRQRARLWARKTAAKLS